jgi:hypothetical protein
MTLCYQSNVMELGKYLFNKPMEESNMIYFKHLHHISTHTYGYIYLCYEADMKSGFLFFYLFIAYSYCLSGQYLLSCFYLKHTTFRRLNSVSIFRWNLLSWAQSIELFPISGYQQSQNHNYFTTGGLSPINSSW